MANGNGTKEYTIRRARELRGVATDLAHRYRFNDSTKKHGREKVAPLPGSYDSDTGWI